MDVFNIMQHDNAVTISGNLFVLAVEGFYLLSSKQTYKKGKSV